MGSYISSLSTLPLNDQILSNDVLTSFEEVLRAKILGQDTAIANVLLKLQDRQKQHRSKAPLMIMTFHGPQGVGQTPMAKAIAAHVYKSTESFLRLDMNDHYSEMSISVFKQKMDMVAKVGQVVAVYNLSAIHPYILSLFIDVLYGCSSYNMCRSIFIFIQPTVPPTLPNRDRVLSLLRSKVEFAPLSTVVVEQIIKNEWERKCLANNIHLDETDMGQLKLLYQNGWRDVPRHLIASIAHIYESKSLEATTQRSDDMTAGPSSKRKRNGDENSPQVRKNLKHSKNSTALINSDSNNTTRDSINDSSDNSINDSNNQSNNITRTTSVNHSLNTTTTQLPTNSGNYTATDTHPEDVCDVKKLTNGQTLFLDPAEVDPASMQRCFSPNYFEHKFGSPPYECHTFKIVAASTPGHVHFDQWANNPMHLNANDRNDQLVSSPCIAEFKVRQVGKGYTLSLGNKHVGFRQGKFVLKDTPSTFFTKCFFAPVRSNINVEFYQDGKEYFSAAFKAIMEAKTSVYMADWAITIDMFLIRPATEDAHRLDKLLEHVARKGVEVKILVYNNLEKAMVNHRPEIAKKLQGIPNIEVVFQNNASLGQSSQFTRWSHHQKLLVVDRAKAFLGGLDFAENRYDTEDHSVVNIEGEFPGGDYRNPRVQGPIDRTQHPRMPWHDVQVSVDGTAAQDAVVNFIQRWNCAIKSIIIMKSYGTPLAISSQVPAPLSTGSSRVQVLRSMKPSSSGESTAESSIFYKMRDMINSARFLVYIEQQYFIDPTAQLTSVIVRRILRASKAGEKFTVVVILPQYPDNGDLASQSANAVMRQQRQTIKTMLEELKMECCPEEYIRFYSLRQHGQRLDGTSITEQIYVHAKVMITDQELLIGSANINDRSLAGDNDSELALIVYEPTKARQLLLQLVREHCGHDLPDAVEDYADFFAGKFWRGTAKANKKIYCKVFGNSIPDNEPTSFAAYKSAATRIPTSPHLLHKVSSHLVLYPHLFLSDELAFDNRSFPTKVAQRAAQSIVS